jgi:hypothetical protein
VWIITAWQSISLEVTVKGSKLCCTFKAVDGTDGDDMLWNGRGKSGNVMSECEEGEDTDCEGGDSDTDW